MKALDKFASEIKANINERFGELKGIKNKMSKELQDQLDQEFDPIIRSKIYAGSEIKDNSTRNLMKKLLKMDPAYYKLLERRIEENHPRINSKITKIKNKILAESTKIGSQEEFRSFELKQELEGLLQNNQPQNEDYDILQSLVYARDLENDKISLKNMLFN